VKRRCWTCNTDHDPNLPCRQSPMAKARRAAGGTDDLFDDVREMPMFGSVITARYESECPSCDELILPGEDIRSDGLGRYIHADDACERMARA
jgi:hypothetical protein